MEETNVTAMKLTGMQVAALRKALVKQQKHLKQQGRKYAEVALVREADGTVHVAHCDEDVTGETCDTLKPDSDKVHVGGPVMREDALFALAEELFPTPPIELPDYTPKIPEGLTVKDVVEGQDKAGVAEGYKYTDAGRGGEAEVDLDS